MRVFAMLPLCLLLVAVVACRPGDEMPALRQVRPAAVTPGALVLLSGERLDRVATVAIGGQLAADVTLVNDALLTAVAPAGLVGGVQTLALRAVDGRVLYAAVVVAAAPAVAASVEQPRPSPAPPSPASSPAPDPTTHVAPAPAASAPVVSAPVAAPRDTRPAAAPEKPDKKNDNKNQPPRGGNGRGR